MAKYATVLGDELHTPTPGPRPRFLRTVLLFVILAVSPLAYEGGLIVYGNWQAMVGTYVEVRTPMLDRVAVAWQSLRDEVKYQAPSFLRGGRLPPLVIVGTVAGLAIFGSLFLRRG
jgi:hypothetical protein